MIIRNLLMQISGNGRELNVTGMHRGEALSEGEEIPSALPRDSVIFSPEAREERNAQTKLKEQTRGSSPGDALTLSSSRSKWGASPVKSKPEQSRKKPATSTLSGASTTCDEESRARIRRGRERVMKATTPSLRDDNEARKIKEDFRKSYGIADKEYASAIDAMKKGRGIHAVKLADGTTARQEITGTANGNTLITTRYPDGHAKQIEVNPEKHPEAIEVRESRPPSKDREGKEIPGRTDILYRYGSTLRQGPDCLGVTQGKGDLTRYDASRDDEVAQMTMRLENPRDPNSDVCTEKTVGADGKTVTGDPVSPEARKRRAEQMEKSMQRAKKSNEIPFIRSQITNNERWLDANGNRITGSGQVIAYIDANYNDFLDSSGYHGFGTEAIMNTPDEGVAPGARVRGFNDRIGWDGSSLIESPYRLAGSGVDGNNPSRKPVMKDDPEELAKNVSKSVSDAYLNMSRRMDDIAGRREPGMNVLNMSMGVSPSDYMGQIFALLDKKGENGEFSYPAIREKILGGQNLSTEEQMKKVAGYFNGLFNDTQGPIQAALEKYQETTARIAKEGMSIVVAAMNVEVMAPPSSGEKPPSWASISAGAALNLFGRSRDVITVAASDSNGTPGPGNRGDDTIAFFSSRGEGEGGWNPTIAAPGVDIMSRRNAVRGTSLAAPYVSGVIALMKQANPNLTTAQIREILRSTATDIVPGESADGAGVINPERAVEQALRLAGLLR